MKSYLFESVALTFRQCLDTLPVGAQVFDVLLPISALSPHAYLRLSVLSPAHSRSLPLTPAQSRSLPLTPAWADARISMGEWRKPEHIFKLLATHFVAMAHSVCHL